MSSPLAVECLRASLAALLVACAIPAARAQAVDVGCGPLENAFGPFDYRNEGNKENRLHLVTIAHFTPEVEALVRGRSGRLGGDLDYTLRAFPNHHRALIAVMRYGEKLKTPQPPDLPRPVECYFDRALRFRPDDTVARMIYAKFLVGSGRPAQAMQQLRRASVDAKDDAFAHYNAGLIYFEMKAYTDALAEAHKAMALGFPKTALRDQLKSVGQWSEPQAQAASAAASS